MKRHGLPKFAIISISTICIAVATLAGLPAIIICNNRPLPADMLEAARKEKIMIFRTAANQFVTSYQVYRLLHGT